MTILTVHDIEKKYGFSKKYIYQLTSTRGCPVLPREVGGKIRVIQDDFEKWMHSCKQ